MRVLRAFCADVVVFYANHLAANLCEEKPYVALRSFPAVWLRLGRRLKHQVERTACLEVRRWILSAVLHRLAIAFAGVGIVEIRAVVRETELVARRSIHQYAGAPDRLRRTSVLVKLLRRCLLHDELRRLERTKRRVGLRLLRRYKGLCGNGELAALQPPRALKSADLNYRRMRLAADDCERVASVELRALELAEEVLVLHRRLLQCVGVGELRIRPVKPAALVLHELREEDTVRRHQVRAAEIRVEADDLADVVVELR